jgi:hypothetical protein
MPGPLPMLPQALALLTVRLLAQQLRYTPALLGPRTAAPSYRCATGYVDTGQ